MTTQGTYFSPSLSSDETKTVSDIAQKVVGTCVRLGASSQAYLVESCTPSHLVDKVCLGLVGLSGETTESLMDVAETPVPSVQKLAKEMFFAPREVCPLCGITANESLSLFSVRQLFWEVAVNQCRQCGMAYKESVPQQRLLDHIYGPGYVHFSTTEDLGSIETANRSRVKRLGKPQGRHLDYGCGAGHFVWSAYQAGWDSYGVDPFLPEVTQSVVTDRLYKADVTNPSIVTLLGKFDCISMWAVVEHLSSFSDTIIGLVRLLKPGGTIVFNSPNAHSLIARRSGRNWRMATLVEHLQFCTPSAAKWLAHRWNLKIRGLRIAGSPYPFGRNEGGFSAQGIDVPPFQTWTLNQDAAHSSAITVGAQWSMPGLIGPLYQRLLADGGDGLAAKTMRSLIHTLRAGDHIEVVLSTRPSE